MKYEPTEFSVSELAEAWKDSSLKTNPEYQRGATWKLVQKQSLIDSAFRRYPIPPIFLHQIRSPGLRGVMNERFEIVDGQQRIRALAEYLADDFALLESTDKKLKIPNSLRQSGVLWGNKRFSELPEKLKVQLSDLKVQVYLITGIDHSDEVRDLFIRLQSGTPLTRQQVRDAWPGGVGPFVETLAGKQARHPSVDLFQAMDKRGGGADDRYDRYVRDREFCAQLLCLFLARERDPNAEQSISANALDATYHSNTDFSSDGESAKQFRSVLDLTTKVVKKARTIKSSQGRMKKKFRKLDIIALFLFLQARVGNPQFKPNITELAVYLDSEKDGAKGRSTSGRVISEYYHIWEAGAPAGFQLDPKRNFDDAQKQELSTLAGGRCAICGEMVDEGDDEYDHFPTPHRLGGRTEIANGRLVHKRCHPRGRPRDNDRAKIDKMQKAFDSLRNTGAEFPEEILAQLRIQGVEVDD